jgi:hypothetical protein
MHIYGQAYIYYAMIVNIRVDGGILVTADINVC